MNAPRNHPDVMLAEQARAELYGTLDQLRDRLNYAQRFDAAVERTRLRIAAERRRSPVAFTIGVVAVAASAGAVAWGVASAVAKRF